MQTQTTRPACDMEQWHLAADQLPESTRPCWIVYEGVRGFVVFQSTYRGKRKPWKAWAFGTLVPVLAWRYVYIEPTPPVPTHLFQPQG